MPGFWFSDLAPPYFQDFPILADQEYLRIGRHSQCDLYLPDPQISRDHARVYQGKNGYWIRDFSRNGTRINHRAIQEHILKDGDRLEMGRFHFRFHQERPNLPETERTECPVEVPVIGQSPAIQKILGQARLAAATHLPVILFGETGTGKEVIAHFIHEQSAQRQNPLFTVNCAALSETLLESELFGHERGSFTGAVRQRKGLLEAAHQSSLFLDEIGELPLALQPKLLRALEEMKIRRLGSNVDVAVQTRLITATNRDLVEEIQRGNFREDLFHRLDVFALSLPPLRERKEDIPLLVKHLLQKSGFQKSFSKEALEKLSQYSWPGNIRELRNVLLKAAVLSSQPTILPEALDLSGGTGTLSRKITKYATPLPLPASPGCIQEQEIHLIQCQLQNHHWHRLKTAEALGISRTTLYHKMRKYGLV